jgi:hypothetical protein
MDLKRGDKVKVKSNGRLAEIELINDLDQISIIYDENDNSRLYFDNGVFYENDLELIN